MAPALDRPALLADASLAGAAWCRAYSEHIDQWLAGLFEDASTSAPVDGRLSLCAVGGYGRAELCPQSDIDVVLVHEGQDGLGAFAERLWYPIWDEGLKLGHGVRTIKEAVALAAADLDTATSLLDVRLLAGDAELATRLADDGLALWKKRSRRWLGEIADRVAARQRKAGEVAFLLEPDLKEGRGGLRDVHAIRWADAADRVSLEGDDDALAASYSTLLAARVELHRRTERAGDILLLQEQDGVAASLGLADADVLMQEVSTAGRTIAWRSDEVWDRIASQSQGGLRWRSARDRIVAPGCVLRDGRMALTADADPVADPALVLRIAAAAAEHAVRIERGSLLRLAEQAGALPEPWPAEARDAFVRLLLAGPPAIWVIESLDQVGLWVALIPEWQPNRNHPQRNAYHRFTVDRHLCETAVEASALVSRVDRPDLLVLGALLHDIGKGYPGDHALVGIDLARTILGRMGYPPDDLDVMAILVEHHLLLPDVATRRDIGDDDTIRYVAERAGSASVLRLLGALTEADSLATGPAAWGTWKAELVAELVARTAGHFGEDDGREVVSTEFPTDEQVALLTSGEHHISGDDDRLTVVVPDRPGLFSRVAGALALHGLDVLEAAIHTHDNGMALESFRVESSLSPTIAWDRVLADVERAVSGRLALESRLTDRARSYERRLPKSADRRQVLVRFDNDISGTATVIEIFAPDAIGVLYRATRALADLDLDIRSAKVQTLGPEVVDSFYVVDALGEKMVDAGHLAEVERALRHALDPEQQ